MDELKIVMMGKTGSGKSSTGNTIVGDEVFEYMPSAASVTNACQRHDAKINERKIAVVDTPGFFDTNVPQEKVTQEISRCISLTTPGPHAFLFVISIGRFTEEEINTVKLFFRHFGQNVEDYMIVVFTRADDLDGIPLDRYLVKAPSYLQDVIKNCGGRYIAIDNKNKPQGQVERLLDLIDKTVKKNGMKCYTNVMYEENIKMLKKQEEELRKKHAEEEKKKIQKIEKTVTDKFNVQMKEHEKRSNELQRQIDHYESQVRYLRETMNEKSETYKEFTNLIETLHQQKENQQRQYQEQMNTMQMEIQKRTEQQIQMLQEQHKQQMEMLSRMNTGGGDSCVIL